MIVYRDRYLATTGGRAMKNAISAASNANIKRLSAGALRRVREYVQLHLDESIDLSRLAAVAGLSMHHFAREFKQSAGVTPHHYLIQERVERAQQMLAQTDLSLAEITYAVGFSDQGHLARHFRGLLGTTPREFGGRNVRSNEDLKGWRAWRACWHQHKYELNQPKRSKRT